MTKIKYLFRFFLLIALIATSLETQAQVKYALKAGLNMSDIKHIPKGEFYVFFDTKKQLGYHFGVTVDCMLKDEIGLQTGLMFYRKGYDIDFNNIQYYFGPSVVPDFVRVEGEDKFTTNYLEVPLNVFYKINRFQVYTGGYIARGISGKREWDFFSAFGETSGENDFKPVLEKVEEGDLEEDQLAFYALDFGLNFGVGYQMGPILFNLGYSLGLGNISPEQEEGGRYDGRDVLKRSNRIVSFSMSYILNE